MPQFTKSRIDLGKVILVFVVSASLLGLFFVSATNRENSLLHEFKCFDRWLGTLHSPGKPHTSPEAWFDFLPREVFRFFYLFNLSFLSLFLIWFLLGKSLEYVVSPRVSRSRISLILMKSSYPFILLTFYLILEETAYSRSILVPDEVRFGVLTISLLLVFGTFLHLSQSIIREGVSTRIRPCWLDRPLFGRVLVLSSLVGLAAFLRFWELGRLSPNSDEITVFWDFGYVCDRIQRGKWINNLLYFIWNHPHPHLFERWASSRVSGQWTGHPALFQFICGVVFYIIHGETYVHGSTRAVPYLLKYVFYGRYVAAFFGVAMVFVTYLIGKLWFDEEVAILSAFILALTPLHVKFSRLQYVDSLMGLLVMVAIFFSARTFKVGSMSLVFSAISFGLALATKPFAILALPIISTLLLSNFLEKSSGINRVREHTHIRTVLLHSSLLLIELVLLILGLRLRHFMALSLLVFITHLKLIYQTLGRRRFGLFLLTATIFMLLSFSTLCVVVNPCAYFIEILAPTDPNIHKELFSYDWLQIIELNFLFTPVLCVALLLYVPFVICNLSTNRIALGFWVIYFAFFSPWLHGNRWLVILPAFVMAISELFLSVRNAVFQRFSISSRVKSTLRLLIFVFLFFYLNSTTVRYGLQSTSLPRGVRSLNPALEFSLGTTNIHEVWVGSGILFGIFLISLFVHQRGTLSSDVLFLNSIQKKTSTNPK